MELARLRTVLLLALGTALIPLIGAAATASEHHGPDSALVRAESHPEVAMPIELPAPQAENEDGETSDEARRPEVRGEENMLMGSAAINDQAREAIRGALRFIVANQDEETGRISNRGQQRYAISVTALGGLAMLASGSTPGRGPYGRNIELAVEYLLSVQGRIGYFHTTGDHSRIHGHGYATQFLAHTYGMLRDGDLRDNLRRALTRAVRLTEESQTDLGGWGYTPDDRHFDEASTTVTQIQALRACRDAGIKVNERVIDRAIQYVHNSAVAIDWVDQDGVTRQGYNFVYSLRWNSSRVSFPLTAAAISVLHGAGAYEGRILQGGLDWIFHFFLGRTDVGDTSWYDRWFYYGHFYAAQAMYQAPDESYWNEYYPRIRDVLLDRAQSREVRLGDGSTETHYTWSSNYGEVYAAAISALVLQVPRGYLPLFQR